MPGIDTEELLTLALDLADRAGALVLEALDAAHAGVDTKTSGTDMVSDVDRASERLIVEALRAARPGDSVVGEEGGAHEGTSGVRWVIDPLDGTTNYLYRLPAFTVSIAAEIDGRREVGVVADPVHAETFAARRGGGATCNGSPIGCSTKNELTTALVGTGFSYDAERRRHQAGVLTVVLPRVRDIRRAGAASLDLCWVACGRLDAFYEQGLQPWDFAAGALIASEAGATVGDLDGGPPSGAFTMAAGPALFGPLRQLLVEAF
ncbi:MAG TPA: inositol monophosphatase family protein [Acidimicrobiales bacterium]|nr:inositol monophosphatase family protein [Acidimicrobiales bacterium]